MDKIKELVERVRLTDEEIDRCFNQWSEETNGNVSKELGNTFSQAIAEAQLNKVLNDPDLALIDREILTNPHTTISEMLDAIIPIAGAIKEAQDD